MMSALLLTVVGLVAAGLLFATLAQRRASSVARSMPEVSYAEVSYSHVDVVVLFEGSGGAFEVHLGSEMAGRLGDHLSVAAVKSSAQRVGIPEGRSLDVKG
jgi:hypothetical protein